MISGDFTANKELSFGIYSQSSTYQNHRLNDLGWNWPWHPINTLVSTEGNAIVVDDEEDD
jgi:hypothetical protein